MNKEKKKYNKRVVIVNWTNYSLYLNKTGEFFNGNFNEDITVEDLLKWETKERSVNFVRKCLIWLLATQLGIKTSYLAELFHTRESTISVIITEITKKVAEDDKFASLIEFYKKYVFET